MNSLQCNSSDPGAARAAAEVVQLVTEAPDVSDGSAEWSLVARAEEDDVRLLREAACRQVTRQSLTGDQLCMRIVNRALCLRLLDGPRSDVTWPDDIDLELSRGRLGHPGRSEGQTQVPYNQ